MLVFGNKRLDFVCQTGGNNPKIKWRVTGLESMVEISIMRNQLPLTPKGVVNVFDLETKKWLGYIKKDNETSFCVNKYPADEELYFSDFYVEGK